jgi:hypothetical protein
LRKNNDARNCRTCYFLNSDVGLFSYYVKSLPLRCELHSRFYLIFSFSSGFLNPIILVVQHHSVLSIMTCLKSIVVSSCHLLPCCYSFPFAQPFPFPSFHARLSLMFGLGWGPKTSGPLCALRRMLDYKVTYSQLKEWVAECSKRVDPRPPTPFYTLHVKLSQLLRTIVSPRLAMMKMCE